MYRTALSLLYMILCFHTADSIAYDPEDDKPFPVKPSISLVTPDNFSDLTFGISWDAVIRGPASLLGVVEKEQSDWTFDHRMVLKSNGSLLFDNQLNRDPIHLFAAYDIGFQGRPVTGIVDPDVLIPPDHDEDASLPWWANYRFAIYAEAGAEADQGWENPLARIGPSLWFINMTESTVAALLPTLSVGLNAVYSLETPEIQGVRIKEWYSRFHVMSRHDMNFDFVSSKLSHVHMIGVLQYSKDFGQIDEYREEDLDTAFGWYTDLAYTLRWLERSGTTRRSDLFIRFSGGRIVPLLEDDRSFIFGIRMIF